ncbi:uncharacterized protein MEPE_00991 [Melanopsichium pennsylvanicum]|uniref:Uncharacterized protein n=2 Tax=Melanopsichium pennsylvanicum TaxID=63383 RepID=A0AAJ4XHN2_9BASI|nr:hypothetical protein BN887_03826 [Melanopsichium pennsylvanicum 4]SNX82285.1 uncharacterized protein MEPE_00991 [Melanopsichium pennsylvanicum]
MSFSAHPPASPSKPTNPVKRNARITTILANPAPFAVANATEGDDDIRTPRHYASVYMNTNKNEDDRKAKSIDRSETSIPISYIRSTISPRKDEKSAIAIKKEMVSDDDTVEESDVDSEAVKQTHLSKVRKVLNSGDIRDSAAATATVGNGKPQKIILSLPSTPKKVRTTAGASKGESPTNKITTPKKQINKEQSASSSLPGTPKKEKVNTSIAPVTPRSEPQQVPPACPEHVNDLNFAILKVVHEDLKRYQASELYDASPSLLPWKIKDRLLVKVRQLLKDANGGEVANKRWEVEQKPKRKGFSPKKNEKKD